MTPYEVRNDVMQFWKTHFSDVKAQFPNLPLPSADRNSLFVDFDIEFTKSQTVGTGESQGTKTRPKGFLAITVNVPIGTGNKASYEMASRIIQEFSIKRLSTSVSTYSGWINDERYDQEHYAMIVLIPFITLVG